jgi:hypothetical protein
MKSRAHRTTRLTASQNVRHALADGLPRIAGSADCHELWQIWPAPVDPAFERDLEDGDARLGGLPRRRAGDTAVAPC